MPALVPPNPIATELLDKLEALNPDQMTPIEALMALAELKQGIGG